jgi:CDP-diglyceride synthetase
MLLLISKGPYRDLARIILGAILLVIGVVIKATNPHYVLIAAGLLLIVVGVGGGFVNLRKRRAGSEDQVR